MTVPYTHPIASHLSEFRTIRSHFIGHTTPREDPSHYLQCCLDLFARYHKVLLADPLTDPSLPLVINCCGWIHGTGLDLLLDLICRMQPSHVVYMSRQGPEEVHSRLAALVSSMSLSLHILTSQPFPPTTQGISDLHLMQMRSYFSLEKSSDEPLKWKFPALRLSEFKTLTYAGPRQLIHGILVLGDKVHPTCVADLIEGSVLGVVLIEEDIAFAQLGLDLRVATSNIGHDLDNRGDDAEIEHTNPKLGDRAQNTAADLTDYPRTIRTNEHIPYISIEADGQRYLEPAKTRALGQVVMCGINHQTRSFEVSTPISQNSFERWHSVGLKILLVRGQLDHPTWICREQLTARLMRKAGFFESAAIEKRGEKGLMDGQGYPEGHPMFDLDCTLFNRSWTRVGTNSSRVRYKTKVWRSRKNIRHHQRKFDPSGT